MNGHDSLQHDPSFMKHFQGFIKSTNIYIPLSMWTSHLYVFNCLISFWKWQNCSKAQALLKRAENIFKKASKRSEIISIVLVYNAWHQWNTVYAPKHNSPNGWKWLFVKSLKTAKLLNKKYWIQLQYNISSRFIWP